MSKNHENLKEKQELESLRQRNHRITQQLENTELLLGLTQREMDHRSETFSDEAQLVKNDARLPNEGTKCRAVWEALDALAENNEAVDLNDARLLAENNDWNMNNTVIEFYQWRKFHLISDQAVVDQLVECLYEACDKGVSRGRLDQETLGRWIGAIDQARGRRRMAAMGSVLRYGARADAGVVKLDSKTA